MLNHLPSSEMDITVTDSVSNIICVPLELKRDSMPYRQSFLKPKLKPDFILISKQFF